MLSYPVPQVHLIEAIAFPLFYFAYIAIVVAISYLRVSRLQCQSHSDVSFLPQGRRGELREWESGPTHNYM